MIYKFSGSESGFYPDKFYRLVFVKIRDSEFTAAELNKKIIYETNINNLIFIRNKKNFTKEITCYRKDFNPFSGDLYTRMFSIQ